ncbi:carbohydrate ABC transporter permease [Fastidiosipila sanguinis]|uniref:Carbohydrate ABC transporter permease n=1 Tax=Fastidiosipila sanguinis TaxID=236753 RepID=A0A2S0KL21_9FIRM|nr:carbohydrate ABC transporter permease [Fastidiosipila sanguinis]AVM41711.1 carbohydrate ABC transporter permease [Fastidiosipila sanguinis]
MVAKKVLTKSAKVLFSIILIIWSIFPIYWMFTLAFRSASELSGNLSILPKSFSLDNFAVLFTKHNFLVALKNSITVTLVSLIISLFIGVPASYLLSRTRFKFKLRNVSLFWVLLVRVIPPIAFAIPLYFIFNSLGWSNTIWPLILANVLLNLPLIIWYLLTAVDGLSESIEESARIDGANEYQIFSEIVLPRLMPAISAVAILSFMTSWNEYLFAVIFTRKPDNFTVPLLLSTMNSEQELTQWGQVGAAGVISIIPVLVFVIFAQKLLKENISAGAVKG